MFSSNTTIRLFVLFSLLASVVHAHDVRHTARDHASIQRMLKKRAPQGDILGPIGGGTGDKPPDPSSSLLSSSSLSATATSSGSSSSSSSSSTGTSSSTSAAVTGSSNSTSSSTTSSSSTSANTSTTPTPTDTLNLAPSPDASTVTRAGVTKTASVEPTPSTIADRQSNVSNNGKSMTVTILIVIGAAVGGIAILWTIFRKWKLSRSKDFDRRLNPNWTPPTTDFDDSPIPTHRARRTSDSSFNSGSGHGHGAASLEHDFTAGANLHSTPVGGYADLARGASPNPQMQEQHLNRDASFNRGFEHAVPLHHQAGGYKGPGNNRVPFEAYDYNGQGVRY